MIQALCVKPFCFRKAVVEMPGFHKCYKIVGICQFLQSRDEGPSDPHHKDIALQPQGTGLIRQIAFLTSFLRQVSSALRPGDSGCHLAFVWLPGASPMAHLILTPKSTEIPSLLTTCLAHGKCQGWIPHLSPQRAGLWAEGWEIPASPTSWHRLCLLGEHGVPLR